MKLIVEWINPEKGADASSFEGEKVEFMTESSGALVVFETLERQWAAFGPGVWTRIYRG